MLKAAILREYDIRGIAEIDLPRSLSERNLSERAKHGRIGRVVDDFAMQSTLAHEARRLLASRWPEKPVFELVVGLLGPF
jgi:hypothetical protein